MARYPLHSAAREVFRRRRVLFTPRSSTKKITIVGVKATLYNLRLILGCIHKKEKNFFELLIIVTLSGIAFILARLVFVVQCGFN